MLPDTSELTRAALAMADAARTAVLPYFRRTGLEADDKGKDRFDPVTEGDRATEIAMRAVLSELRPDDGVTGEEFGNIDSKSGLTWVIDPIDGTRAFLAGAPTWGVLIAVGLDGEAPLLGLIDQPFIGERFFGGPGGAWTEGPQGWRKLVTRPARPLSEAILLTTFPEVGTEGEGRAFRAVSSHARLTRYGFDCYGYALVASGHVDLVIEAGLQPYDIQAPMAVIEAAGGIVTDWKGGSPHAGGRVIAAANESVHAEALKFLEPFA